MKTLMLCSPSPTDATSFYRATGPFQRLKRKMDNFLIYESAEMNWKTLASADVVFMQRPFTASHVKMCEMIKANAIPLWVDYDDDLFAVPRSNPTHRIYSDAGVQNNLVKILELADRITVSTEVLKNKILSIFDQLMIAGRKNRKGPEELGLKLIPNAYDTRLFKYRVASTKPESRNLVSWRGSNTHDEDLWSHTDGIAHALGKNLNWSLNFIGSPFWLSMEKLELIPDIKPTNIMHTETLDPIEYFKFLWITAPAMMIVPLADNPFNQAKSNIAWIEATHAGALTLAPDWPEWRMPGVINYTSPRDFGSKLNHFMRGEYDTASYYKASWEFIQAELTLEKINKSRERILSELFTM